MPAAADPEEPWGELEPIWRIYWVLATRREWLIVVVAAGVARIPQPIKLSEICAAADRFGLSRSQDAFDRFLSIISELDAAHLKLLDKR